MAQRRERRRIVATREALLGVARTVVVALIGALVALGLAALVALAARSFGS